MLNVNELKPDKKIPVNRTNESEEFMQQQKLYPDNPTVTDKLSLQTDEYRKDY